MKVHKFRFLILSAALFVVGFALSPPPASAWGFCGNVDLGGGLSCRVCFGSGGPSIEQCYLN